jgi:hypothetical protein
MFFTFFSIIVFISAGILNGDTLGNFLAGTYYEKTRILGRSVRVIFHLGRAPPG